MIIGLTGGIGSGKSTVAKMFRKRSIPLIDADLVAREVVEPGKKAWEEIVENFGKDILLSDQSLDRKKLGRIIFQDEIKRKKLNDITHPIIISEILSRIQQLQVSHEHIIVDMPLLFESKREPIFDLIIVVYVDKQLQIDRLRERDHLSEQAALTKINAQMDLEEKKEKADYIIYNDKDLEKTEQQVDIFLNKWIRKLE